MQMLFESRKCNHVQHESNTHTYICTNSQISAILKLKTAKNTKRQKQNNAASCENLKLHNEIDARNVQRPSCSPKPPPDPLALSFSLSLSRWQMPQKKLKSWQSLRLRLPTIVAAPSLQLATCGRDAIELVGAVSYRSLCDRRNSA